MKLNIGVMVYELRKKRNIAQGELARGIVSLADLSRFEHGEKYLEKVVVEALFQRMGKSFDKFEVLVPQKEYDLLILREQMYAALAAHNDRELAELLEIYAGLEEDDRTLHCQFRGLMQGILECHRGTSSKQVLAIWEKAVALTFPDWNKKDWDSYFLCTQELQGLLLLAYGEQELLGADSTSYLEQMRVYIEKRVLDEEEKARVYPACLWLLCRNYMRQGKHADLKNTCIAAEQSMSENGILTFMEKVLQMHRTVAAGDALEKIDASLEALDFVFRMVGYERTDNDADLLLRSNQHGEIALSNELIYEMRLARGMSQEELGWDICTQETLSRIEKGGRTPQPKRLEKLMNRLELEPEIYTGYVAVQDYEVLEKIRAYKRAAAKKQKDRTEHLWADIAKALDESIPINRQFIWEHEIAHKLETGELGFEEAVREFEDCLRVTMKQYKGEVYRIPTREEVCIINQIALICRRKGDCDEAIKRYQAILERYNKSRVAEYYHAIPKALVYLNFAAVLEVADQLEKSETIARKGLHLAMLCMRGDWIAPIITNLAYVYEKRGGRENIELQEQCLRHGIRLLYLFDRKEDGRMVEKIYAEKSMMLL